MVDSTRLYSSFHRSVTIRQLNISISEHTLNSMVHTSIIINCYHCCGWSVRADCTAQLDALDLVKDADSLRGRFATGCYALGAWSSQRISITDGVESSVSKK